MTSLDDMLYQLPQKPRDPQADIQSCWEEKEEKAWVRKSHTSTTVLLLLAQCHLDIFGVEGSEPTLLIAACTPS